jgi:hypothetical protein
VWKGGKEGEGGRRRRKREGGRERDRLKETGKIINS